MHSIAVWVRAFAGTANYISASVIPAQARTHILFQLAKPSVSVIL
jgi:hypothetical protein